MSTSVENLTSTLNDYAIGTTFTVNNVTYRAYGKYSSSNNTFFEYSVDGASRLAGAGAVAKQIINYI